jgi:hypothetical protein
MSKKFLELFIENNLISAKMVKVLLHWQLGYVTHVHDDFLYFIPPNEIIFFFWKKAFFWEIFITFFFKSYFVVYSLYLLTDIHKLGPSVFLFFKFVS